MKWFGFAMLGCLLLASDLMAYGFTPTQNEFNSWDSRCKTAYSSTDPGRMSGYYYPKLTNQQIRSASAFGEAAGGAWHYCAGLVYLQRAQITSGNERLSNLKSALGEIKFTARNIELNNSWYTEIQIDLAKAYIAIGDKPAGMSALSKLLISKPNESLPYTATAFYLRRDGKLDDAIAVLKRAPEVVINQSAELNYFLGWYLMEAGKEDEALPYAKRAYALNYPVPTLRQRLALKGHSW